MPRSERPASIGRRAACTVSIDSRRGGAASSSRAIARKRWRQAGRRSEGKRSFMVSSLAAIAAEIPGAVRRPGTDNRTSRCAFKHKSFRLRGGPERGDVGDHGGGDGGEEGEGDEDGEGHLCSEDRPLPASVSGLSRLGLCRQPEIVVVLRDRGRRG